MSDIDELRLDLTRSMHNAGLYPDHDDTAAQLLGEFLYKAEQYAAERELEHRIRMMEDYTNCLYGFKTSSEVLDELKKQRGE